MWHTSDGLSISQYIKLAVRYTLLLRFILLFFRVRARKLGRDHEISFFFYIYFALIRYSGHTLNSNTQRFVDWTSCLLIGSKLSKLPPNRRYKLSDFTLFVYELLVNNKLLTNINGASGCWLIDLCTISNEPLRVCNFVIVAICLFGRFSSINRRCVWFGQE